MWLSGKTLLGSILSTENKNKKNPTTTKKPPKPQKQINKLPPKFYRWAFTPTLSFPSFKNSNKHVRADQSLQCDDQGYRKIQKLPMW